MSDDASSPTGTPIGTTSRRGFLKLLGLGGAAGAAAAAVPSYLLGRIAKADPPSTELLLTDDVITLKPRTSDPSALQAASLWFVSPDWRTSLDGSTVTQLENRTQRGAANGYATLDGSVLLPLAQLPTHDIVTKHTGVITDAQHGARTVASAHRHSDLASIGTDDHHAKVHADAEHSLVYEKQSNKGIASGYASLDGSTLVPTAQLGSGTADATTFLRGDRTWGAPSVAGHNILSSTHSDTTAASVARGDVIAGVGASPKWERIAIGANGRVLHSDGTDVAWAQLKFTELDFTSSNLTSLATRAHADLQSVTADQHHAQLHKAAHVSGGGDTFAKGDVLLAAPRYLESVSDPASDSQRLWLNVARIRYWSNEGTPVKYDVATLTDIPTVPAFATPAIVLGSAAAAGAASTVIRSDSTIAAFDTTAPTTSAVGDAAAVGVVAFAARRDHLHGREAFVTPAIVLGSSAAAGSATTHIRSDATIAAFDATVPTTSAVGDAAAVGSAAFAARRDHVHGREAFATNAILLGSSAAAGSATSLMRRDDTIAAFDATVPTTSAMADAAAVGVINFAARRDHRHGRESFATPGILLGSAAAAGSATTPIRSDSTIAAFDTTAPTTSAVGDAAAVGTIAFAARRDHLHGREAFAVPVKVTPAALSAAGVATTVTRSDHAHQAPGGVARIVADVAIANTETAVITWTPGANFLIAGTTVRITGTGTLTSGGTPGTCTLNVRCGVNATTGTVASSRTIVTGTSQTNVGFWFEALLTVRTTGASGTCMAEITFLSQTGAAPVVSSSATTATAVIDTTSASTVISLSMISGNAGTTYTWKVATIEVVHMG